MCCSAIPIAECSRKRPLGTVAERLSRRAPARSRDIRREVTDTSGRMAVMRMNCLHPPFDDVRIRRADDTEPRQSFPQFETKPALPGTQKKGWRAWFAGRVEGGNA